MLIPVDVLPPRLVELLAHFEIDQHMIDWIETDQVVVGFDDSQRESGDCFTCLSCPTSDHTQTVFPAAELDHVIKKIPPGCYIIKGTVQKTACMYARKEDINYLLH